jgi:hypothetical protein
MDTIGDAYVVIGGLSGVTEQNVRNVVLRMVEVAGGMQASLAEYRQKTGYDIQVKFEPAILEEPLSCARTDAHRNTPWARYRRGCWKDQTSIPRIWANDRGSKQAGGNLCDTESV